MAYLTWPNFCLVSGWAVAATGALLALSAILAAGVFFGHRIMVLCGIYVSWIQWLMDKREARERASRRAGFSDHSS